MRERPRGQGGRAAWQTRPWHAWWPGQFSSLRVRVMLWSVAVLALVLAVAGGALYAIEQQSLLAQLDNRVEARLRQLAGAYDVRSGRLVTPPDAATARGDEVVLLLTPGGRVVQVQAAGQLSAVKEPWSLVVQTLRALAQSANPSMADLGLLLTTPAGATKAGLPANTAARAALFRLGGLPLTAQRRVRALLVVGLRSEVSQQMDALAQALETVAPLMLLLCAGGGYWLADRALHPIGAITRAAQQIGATDLSRRLNLRRRDELGQLGATFDGMLDRLEAAFARQRQFTADASHELRTPLAIIDLEATRALAQPRTHEEYQEAMAIVQQEAGYMARLVDDLLLLARADSDEAALQRGEVDLAEVVFDVAERLAPLARQSAMTLQIDPLPELLVWGDQTALARMLTNIVENALKYGAGQATHARISSGRRDHDDVAGVWLRVADDGPGIAAEHLPHLGERFYRADRARTHDSPSAPEPGAMEARPMGSGLGLAISRWAVAAHGGYLCIQSERGQGTVVEVWLPTCDAPGATREGGPTDP